MERPDVSYAERGQAMNTYENTYDLNDLFTDQKVLTSQSFMVRSIKKSGAGDTGYNDAYQDDCGGPCPIPH